MLLRAACTSVAAAAICLAAAGPTSAQARVSCGPARAATIASNGQARVYVTGGVVWACDHRGRTATLGRSGNCIQSDRVQAVALAGEVVAAATERCGIDTGSTVVAVRSLSQGRVLASLTAGTSPGPESYTTVSSLVVRADGAAAWIADSTSLGGGRRLVEVWRLERSGARRLDSGGAITPGSLRLRGRTLTWRDAGRTRSATLS